MKILYVSGKRWVLPTYLLKFRQFWGKRPPRIFRLRGTRSPVPLLLTPMLAGRKNKTIGSSRILYRNIVIRIHLRLRVKRLC